MGFMTIEDASALVVRGGVYQELAVAEMDGGLFVELVKGKYARLRADGSASLVNLRMEKLEYNGPLFKDKFGRLAVKPNDGYVQMIANGDGTIEPLKITKAD